MDLETRSIPVELEVREEGEGLTLSGYAAVFNRESENLGGFVEVLKPGCFKEVLKTDPDVRGLLNHDANTIFARTRNGSLKLEEDSTGLKFTAQIDPSDEDGRRVYSKVKSGLIDQCSFAFGVDDKGQEWSERDDGLSLREITNIKYLGDVSAVVYPAYPQTSVQARSILQDAGLDFDNIASLISRANRKLPITDSDRDLINASIMVLQSYIPEERASELGTQDSHKDGDSGLLDLMLRELELAEVEHKLTKRSIK
jgi:uncharacterized protein